MYDEEYPDSENDKTKDDEDMSIVDELSDDELKNIEIEDQAAATIDDEETVEKVLRESAGTFFIRCSRYTGSFQEKLPYIRYDKRIK